MLPILHLSSDFDGPVFTAGQRPLAGQVYAGTVRLLHWLETQLGLDGLPEQTDYLRIELYRQSLQQYASQVTEAPFYAASLEADRFATAQGLLVLRDTLLTAGWDFALSDDAPARLRVLAAVETLFRKKADAPEHVFLSKGYADRLDRVCRMLAQAPIPVGEIILYEPEQWMPKPLQRLVEVWRGHGVLIRSEFPAASADPDTDLGWLQRKLTGLVSGKRPARGDGSLLAVSARRDSEAAPLIAGMLANNADWRPLLLLPEMNRTLEQALILQGMPPEGVFSASLARPSLQVLKLAPAFLWEPLDVFKIMEFVTLAVKPLDDGLALQIARVMADRPGLFSDRWFAAVYGYLEQEGVGQELRKQYEFWFDRKRYRADGLAPKAAAVELYDYLHHWARESYSRQNVRNMSLLVLAEQARRIRDLLRALPESQIGYLELERIVRTIYEPSPVQITTGAEGMLDFIHQPGAVTGPVEALLWWNCIFDEPVLPPDPWYPSERQWLSGQGIRPERPAERAQRQLCRRQAPVLRTEHRLMLVAPEQVAGSEALPGLLLGDLEAAFTEWEKLWVDAGVPEGRERLSQRYLMPGRSLARARAQKRARPFLSLASPERLPESVYETPTNLESLFYYPHRWFLRSKALLYPVSLYTVTPDRTLLGNLAHRFFEELLQEQFYAWDRDRVNRWIDGRAPALLEQEGATMLLYGREPERHVFLNRVRHAAWSLITLLRNNEWQVEGTEKVLEGHFSGLPVKGKADLVLRRGEEHAIVDLKWSGARRRMEMIRNREDIQLVLYAHLLSPSGPWPHTAYFILEEGRMVARNNAAFKEAQIADGATDHADVCAQVLARMEKTFTWRMEQLRSGQLELRTARTAPELEVLYGDVLLDVLEMRDEDARWDDYRILLEFMD
jgi:hypothetical protein